MCCVFNAMTIFWVPPVRILDTLLAETEILSPDVCHTQLKTLCVKKSNVSKAS